MPEVYPSDHVLGVLSDSHGRGEITRAAVDVLLEAGAQTLIHLGDVCDDTVLDAMAGHDCHVVFGNCDWNWTALADYAHFLGLTVEHPVGRIRVGEKLIIFAHGDHPAHEHEARREEAAYFLHGHTHQPKHEQVGSTRIINPGALFRASRYTVAWLEPCHDRVRFLDVDRPR